jgi:hypothetical protein
MYVLNIDLLYGQQIMTQVARSENDGSDGDTAPDDGDRDPHPPSTSGDTALETVTCRDAEVQVKPVSK